MSEFKEIPKELWPDESEHVEYKTVYRATKSFDKLTVDDFLPSFVEHQNKKSLFKKLVDRRDFYSVSLYTDLITLKNKVAETSSLKERIKSFSIGFTSIERGVSTREDSNNHVNYYLYDYESNSPKDDFRIIERRSEE